MASLKENGSMCGKAIKICQKRIVWALTVNIFPVSFHWRKKTEEKKPEWRSIHKEGSGGSGGGEWEEGKKKHRNLMSLRFSDFWLAENLSHWKVATCKPFWQECPQSIPHRSASWPWITLWPWPSHFYILRTQFTQCQSQKINRVQAVSFAIMHNPDAFCDQVKKQLHEALWWAGGAKVLFELEKGSFRSRLPESMCSR